MLQYKSQERTAVAKSVKSPIKKVQKSFDQRLCFRYNKSIKRERKGEKSRLAQKEEKKIMAFTTKEVRALYEAFGEKEFTKKQARSVLKKKGLRPSWASDEATTEEMDSLNGADMSHSSIRTYAYKNIKVAPREVYTAQLNGKEVYLNASMAARLEKFGITTERKTITTQKAKVRTAKVNKEYTNEQISKKIDALQEAINDLMNGYLN